MKVKIKTQVYLLYFMMILLIFCGIPRMSYGQIEVSSEHRQTLLGHTGNVYSVAFSPDGQLLASSGADAKIRLWDSMTGAHQKTLTGHTDTVWSLSISPEGQVLASSGRDGTIRLWDLADTSAKTASGNKASKRDADVNGDGAVNILDLNLGCWEVLSVDVSKLTRRQFIKQGAIAGLAIV